MSVLFQPKNKWHTEVIPSALKLVREKFNYCPQPGNENKLNICTLNLFSGKWPSFRGWKLLEEREHGNQSVPKKEEDKNTKNHFEYFSGSFWLCELVTDLQKAVTFFRLHTGEKTNLHS